MNNLLLTLAGALILALGALFVGPYFIDWNSYRTVFEEQATRLAGRPVTVKGNVNLRLLPAPYVSFEKVQIAGGPLGETPPLLQVENYTLWLSVPPLLQGEFEAQAMEIDRPTLRLALGEDGNLNWNGLGQSDVSLPFVPRNVAFKDTNIEGGSLVIASADGTPLTTLSGITGTFTARRLSGPFKFVGDISGRSVRWSTGRFDESGGLRIKGTVKDADAGTTYAADGLLQNLTTRPVFTGGVAGKLRKKGTTGFEMKTDVYADTEGAQFKEITLLLDAEGRPQIVNGAGSAVWAANSRATATIELESRWLDVDRLIAGDGEEKDLRARLDSIQTFLADALPRTISTTARFKATQVNFGGEPLDNLALVVTQNGALTRITSLSASAPGAADIKVSGQIAQPDPTTPGARATFVGNVAVRGRTASRFVNWLNPDWVAWIKQADGAFALDAALSATSDAIGMENIRARLGETRIEGRLARGAADDAPLVVELATDDLDVSRYVADVTAAGTVIRNWLNVAQESSAVDITSIRGTDVRLAIGNLTVGRSEFADVTLDVRRIANRTHIRRATFASATGLDLDAERKSPDRQSGQPNENPLRYILRVRTPEAFDELVKLAGISGIDGAIDNAARALIPAHLAGRVSRDSVENALNVRYDGTVAGNPAVGHIRIDGSETNWRERTWTVTTDVALTKPHQLLSHYGLSTRQPSDDGAPTEPGRIVLYSIGRPAKGLKTDFELQSKNLTIGFAGAVSSADDSVGLAGSLTGKATGQRWMSRLLGQPDSSSADVTFSSQVTRAPNITRLEDVRVASGAATMTGAATFVAKDGSDVVTLDAKVTELSLPTLVAGLAQKKDEKGVRRDVKWMEQPFDFAELKNMTLRATVSAERLQLAENMTAHQATFQLRGGKDRIEVSDLAARVGEGTVAANASLERRRAGAEFTLNARGTALPLLTLSGAQAEQSDDTPVTANGVASVDLSLSGIGLSPKGVISVMKGEGTVSLQNAALTYFSPQVIQDVSADIADENAPTSPADMKARLSERLTDRALNIGSQTIAFRIRDGAAQADKVKFTTPAATITASTFVDIARLRLDSEWRIAPTSNGRTAALPPVTVFYAGDVRNVSGLQPGFGVAALERELTVRRLEGNIDQLEGLQSLRLKKKKETNTDSSSRGRLRPTIGGDPEHAQVESRSRPAPPKPKRRKRRRSNADSGQSAGDGLWNLNETDPPVDLQLQTPEGANPT